MASFHSHNLIQWSSFGGAQIKKSHHSLINPAITITLRSGSGGQGVPPLVSIDGTWPHSGYIFWAVLRRLFRSSYVNWPSGKKQSWRGWQNWEIFLETLLQSRMLIKLLLWFFAHMSGATNVLKIFHLPSTFLLWWSCRGYKILVNLDLWLVQADQSTSLHLSGIEIKPCEHLKRLWKSSLPCRRLPKRYSRFPLSCTLDQYY